MVQLTVGISLSTLGVWPGLSVQSSLRARLQVEDPQGDAGLLRRDGGAGLGGRQKSGDEYGRSARKKHS